LVKDYPGVAEYQSDLGTILSNRAGLLRSRGQQEQAVPLLEEAVACQQAALKAYPQNPVYLDFLRIHYTALAEVLDALDRPEVEGAFRGWVRVDGDLVAVSPRKAQCLSDLVKAENAFARWLIKKGKNEEARKSKEEATRHEQEAAALRRRAAAQPAKEP